jgi:hypothetical protein
MFLHVCLHIFDNGQSLSNLVCLRLSEQYIKQKTPAVCIIHKIVPP